MKSEILKIVESIDFEKIIDHPNILIAAHFWEDERYEAAKVCYRFMRMVDDLVDNRKSSGNSFTDNERECFTDQVKDWINCLDDLSSKDPFVREVVHTLKTFKIPMRLFNNFSRSMIFDINHNGFSTFREFLEYSEGASVAPASVFVHLCCLGKDSEEFVLPSFDVIDVARPCAIFSYLVHIIRDFQKDQHNHLNYFALDILEKNLLTPSDLHRIALGSPVPESFRSVISEYYYHAEKYRNDTLSILEKIKDKVDPRYFLSLLIIYNLYQMVFERINIKSGTFTTPELNPEPGQIKERVLSTIHSYFNNLN